MPEITKHVSYVFPSPNGDCISLIGIGDVLSDGIVAFPSPNGDCISLIGDKEK